MWWKQYFRGLVREEALYVLPYSLGWWSFLETSCHAVRSPSHDERPQIDVLGTISAVLSANSWIPTADARLVPVASGSRPTSAPGWPRHAKALCPHPWTQARGKWFANMQYINLLISILPFTLIFGSQLKYIRKRHARLIVEYFSSYILRSCWVWGIFPPAPFSSSVW